MPDILLIILIILSSILIVLVLINLLITLKKHNEKPIDHSDQINQLRFFLRDDITDFGERMNKSLNEGSLVNNKIMGETRIELIKELNEFKQTFSQNFHVSILSMQENVQKNLEQINQKVESRLTESFEKTNKTFSQIIETMVKIDNAKTAIELLNTEVTGLQNILSNNQSRGAFGEFQLNQILHAVLGERGILYEIQFPIETDKKGSESVRADAAIFLEEPKCVLCIDSKFPFSSYSIYVEEKDMNAKKEEKYLNNIAAEMKKHIDDIAYKYIKKGVTADYALMFVPADGVLALIHARLQTTIEYAFKKSVIIVSPTTIAPTLFSYKMMNVDARRSRKAKEIIYLLDHLANEFQKFYLEWNRLKKAMNSVNSHSDDFDKKVEVLNKQFARISQIDITNEENQESEEKVCQ